MHRAAGRSSNFCGGPHAASGFSVATRASDVIHALSPEEKDAESDPCDVVRSSYDMDMFLHSLACVLAVVRPTARMATHRLAYFHSKTQRCRSLFHSHYFLLLVADFAFCFIRFMQALDSSSCVLVLLSALLLRTPTFTIIDCKHGE